MKVCAVDIDLYGIVGYTNSPQFPIVFYNVFLQKSYLLQYNCIVFYKIYDSITLTCAYVYKLAHPRDTAL